MPAALAKKVLHQRHILAVQQPDGEATDCSLGPTIRGGYSLNIWRITAIRSLRKPGGA
jgi:hypothetical protein